MSVEAVSLKLPAFWVSSPEAWFCHVEAQFGVRNITTDDTKYHYIVAALDSETATRALSVLNSPPATDKYNSLKTFLISAYGLSEPERATALFNLSGLGDSKPSELMDKMLGLLGSHPPCFLFRHLFLQQLPNYVRIPLANSTHTDFRKLASDADKLYLSGKFQHLQTVDVAAPSVTETVVAQLCWFHKRFGDKAKRCERPCSGNRSFTNSGNGQQGQK